MEAHEPKLYSYSADSFLDLTYEEDQAITNRQFLDDAREMAAHGFPKSKIIAVLRSDFLRAGGSAGSWINFYPHALDAVAAAIHESNTAMGAKPDLSPPKVVTSDELYAARMAPECFIEGYMYADVRLLIGAGGLGKSTLLLVETASLAGGAETLWGRQIHRHGPVVYITGEDSREVLVARLRRVIEDNGFSPRSSRIIANVFILDVSGKGFRLTTIEKDTVVTSDDVDQVIEWLTAIRPVMVAFDPIVSFGVGESRVNDAEQGLIEAARRIRNACGCCVTMVAHTGKANAREGSVDQYSGRGGSSMADGARMVHVIAPLSQGDWEKLTGSNLTEGNTAIRLVLAKGTYSPRSSDILIRRCEFRFNSLDATKRNLADVDGNQNAAILTMLYAEIAVGRFPTQNFLIEAAKDKRLPGLTSSSVRKAVARLEYQGLVERRPIPDRGRGGAREYLYPFVVAHQNGAASTDFAVSNIGVPLDSCTATQQTVLPCHSAIVMSEHQNTASARQHTKVERAQ